MVDYFNLLEIEMDADDEAVKAAVKKQRRVWNQRTTHPTPEVRSEAEQKVRDIADAEKILLNPSERIRYCIELKEENQSAPKPSGNNNNDFNNNTGNPQLEFLFSFAEKVLQNREVIQSNHTHSRTFVTMFIDAFGQNELPNGLRLAFLQIALDMPEWVYAKENLITASFFNRVFDKTARDPGTQGITFILSIMESAIGRSLQEFANAGCTDLNEANWSKIYDYTKVVAKQFGWKDPDESKPQPQPQSSPSIGGSAGSGNAIESLVQKHKKLIIGVASGFAALVVLIVIIVNVNSKNKSVYSPYDYNNNYTSGTTVAETEFEKTLKGYFGNNLGSNIATVKIKGDVDLDLYKDNSIYGQVKSNSVTKNMTTSGVLTISNANRIDKGFMIAVNGSYKMTFTALSDTSLTYVITVDDSKSGDILNNKANETVSLKKGDTLTVNFSYNPSSSNLSIGDTENVSAKPNYTPIYGISFDGELATYETTHYYSYTAPKSGTYGFTFDVSKSSVSYIIADENETSLQSGSAKIGSTANVLFEEGKTYYITIYSGETWYSVNIGIPQDAKHIEGNSIIGDITYSGQVIQYKYVSPIDGTYGFSFEGSKESVSVSIVDEHEKTLLSNSTQSYRTYNMELEAGKTYTISISGGITHYEVTIHIPNATVTMTRNSLSGDLTYSGQINKYLFTPSVGGKYSFTASASKDSVSFQVTDEYEKSLLSNSTQSERSYNVELEAGRTYTITVSGGITHYDASIKLPSAATSLPNWGY